MNKTLQKFLPGFIIWCMYSYALQPEIVFDTIYGGNKIDVISCIVKTHTGRYLMGGYSNSFEGSINENLWNPWVFQIEPDGVIEWSRWYLQMCRSSVEAVEQHTDGSLFLACKTMDPDNGNDGTMLIRTGQEGDTLWQRKFNSEYQYNLRDGIITHDGGFLLVGEADTLVPGRIGFWMICVDSAGNELWSNTYGDSVIDTVQRICSICRFGQEGYVGVGQKSNEIFLLRLNTSGDTLWTKTYNWGGLNFPYEIKITREKNFILAGYTIDSATYDSDIFIACSDSSGNLLWKKEYGIETEDELAYTIIQTGDGGYLVAGINIVVLPYRRSSLFLRLNSSGDTLWTLKTLWKLCNDLMEQSEHLYIVAGEVYNDPNDSNASDAWVAKIEEKESHIIHVVPPENHSFKTVLFPGKTVYMDPSSSACLYTLQGRQVLTFSLQSSKKSITTPIPSGVFILRYYYNKLPRVEKLVVRE